MGEEKSFSIIREQGDVSFMGFSRLRLLVEAWRLAERESFAFAVVRGPASLERRLQVTGLDPRLERHDDPAQAVGGGPAGR